MTGALLLVVPLDAGLSSVENEEVVSSIFEPLTTEH